MFSVDSASIQFVEYTSSIAVTTGSTINLSNGGIISASMVSASALYGPSTLADTYTPSLLGIATNNHSLLGMDFNDYPATSSGVSTIIYKQYYVPANTIKPGDIIFCNFTMIKSGSASLVPIISVNSGSSSLGTQLASRSSTAITVGLERYFAVRTNDTILIHCRATSGEASNFVNGTNQADVSVSVTIPNLTGSTYWNFAMRPGAASTHSIINTTFEIFR